MGSALEFPHQLAEEIRGINVERPGDRDELRNVDLALIALDHADDRVRALQERGEIALGESAARAGAGDDGGEGTGGGASEGFHGRALRLAERRTDNGKDACFDFPSSEAYTRTVSDRAV